MVYLYFGYFFYLLIVICKSSYKYIFKMLSENQILYLHSYWTKNQLSVLSYHDILSTLNLLLHLCILR